MQLMEVMPTLLSKRSFKAPMCKRQLEPGYRDAPHPAQPMAIAFIKVRMHQGVECDRWMCQCVRRAWTAVRQQALFLSCAALLYHPAISEIGKARHVLWPVCGLRQQATGPRMAALY